MSKRDKKLFVLVAFIIIVVALTGCPKKVSTGAAAYKGVKVAFQAYDLGMTIASDLHKKGIITDADWVKVKAVGTKFHTALLSAARIAKAYAEAKPGEQEALKDKLLSALDFVNMVQKEFTVLVKELGG